jgi:hypothetical protein
MSARTAGQVGATIGRVLALALAAVVLVAGPAAAQDPYGGTTTTTDPGSVLDPTCTLGLTAGAPGAAGSVRVANVPFGTTVRILLGGVEVGRGTAPVQGQSAAAPVALGGQVLAAGAATTTLDIDFVVPDLSPGRYLVTAVGADFTLTCGPDPDGLFEVLGATQSTDDDGTQSGSLPRTGIYALLLVVVAVALVLAGRAVLAASRRRRAAAERAERAARRARHLAAAGRSQARRSAK